MTARYTATQNDSAPAASPRPGQVMYRISTVVKMTELSRSVIYEQIKAGRLRTVKQGRATRVTAEALGEYIKLLENEARTGQ